MESNIFKILDFFSISNSFSLKRRIKTSSILGISFSIVLILISLLMFIIIGDDFIHSKNPASFTSTYLKTDDSLVNLTLFDFFIALRIKAKEKSSIDLTGGDLYSSYYFVNRTFDQDTGKKTESIETLQLEKCSEKAIQSLSLYDGEYYCLDLGKKNLSGNPFEIKKNYSYFQLKISACELGIFFGFIPELCKEKEDIITMIKKSSFHSSLSLVYPKIYYNPNNKTNPIHITPIRVNFPFEYNTQRSDVLYAGEVLFEDDSGWIIESKSKKRYYSIENEKFYYQFTSDELFGAYNTSSTLYSITVCLDATTKKYGRTYLKLIDVVSNTLGILRVIFFFSNLIFRNVFSYYIRNSKFSQLIFNFAPIKKRIPSTIPFSSLNQSNQIFFSKNESRTNSSIFKKSNGQLRRTSQEDKHSVNYLYSYYAYNIKSTFLCKKYRKDVYYRKTKVVEECVGEVFDLSYYIRLIFGVYAINQFLFPKNAQVLLRNIRKPNINSEEDLENLWYLSNIPTKKDRPIISEFLSTGGNIPLKTEMNYTKISNLVEAGNSK